MDLCKEVILHNLELVGKYLIDEIKTTNFPLNRVEANKDALYLRGAIQQIKHAKNRDEIKDVLEQLEFDIAPTRCKTIVIEMIDEALNNNLFKYTDKELECVIYV